MPKLRAQRNNQHYTCIFEVNYYSTVFNVHFKLTLSTEKKNYFLIDPILLLYTKIFKKPTSLATHKRSASCQK